MVRVGIIGTGQIAEEHAKAILMLPGQLAIVAAADVDAERLSRFCETYNVPRGYSGAAEVMASPNVDLVAIATPPAAHEDVAVAALDAGKHVLCEKPLAQSLSGALRIAAAEARHPGRLGVGYQLRYEASYRRLIWLAHNGWLGSIESALIERHGQIPHADPGRSGWWGAWGVSGGGVLITQVIHELDLLIAACGLPKAVSARMDTRWTKIESEDHAELTMRLPAGGIARCIASVNSPRRGGGITITGSHAEVSLPWKFTAKEPAFAQRALAALDQALPDTREPSASFAARGTRFAKRRLGLAPAPALTPHALLYRDIADAIAAGRPMPIPPSEALKSLELVTAAYESAISGREIELPVEPAGVAARGVTAADWGARRSPRFETRPVAPLARSRDEIRIGFVGVDTSHAPTFAKILHDPFDPFHIPGGRVVAAFPGGSPDMHISASRVGGFTAELRDRHGVKIVDSPEEAADLADVVFILSSDGRLHPALFKAVSGRGKPVFIDKPFAISTGDADEMVRTATTTNTKFLACSAFRYADGFVAALNQLRDSGERITGCTIRYWLQIQPTQGRYFWYGIHAAEMLLAAVGTGVTDVEATTQKSGETITVRHRDGIESNLVGSYNDGTFAVTLQTDKRTIEIPLAASAAAMPSRVLWSALDVLGNGNVPRLWSGSTIGSIGGARPSRAIDPSAEETVEIVHLLDAAQKSHASKQRVAIQPAGPAATSLNAVAASKEHAA